MGLKGLKLSVASQKKPTDPLEVFNKLTLRGSIENIWEPQAEALKGWHKDREKSDIVVQMNTGGGKTLVGLMIAQSLLNELNRRVLYVVPNNQLVEQTLKQATSIGLQPATRYKSEWRNQDGFEAAETFCITNYASVFTGFAATAAAPSGKAARPLGLGAQRYGHRCQPDTSARARTGRPAWHSGAGRLRGLGGP